MYKLINFEKCLDSNVRNVNSKFFSASCMISLLINLLKLITSMHGLSCPQKWLKNAIFCDMISCSLIPPFWRNMLSLLHYRRARMRVQDISKFLLGDRQVITSQNSVIQITSFFKKCLFSELLISNGPIHKNFQCYLQLWQQKCAWTLRILSSY